MTSSLSIIACLFISVVPLSVFGNDDIIMISATRHDDDGFLVHTVVWSSPGIVGAQKRV